MAAGSHGCSPNWADFPAAASTRPNSKNLVSGLDCSTLKIISFKFHEFDINIERAMNVMSPISPIRLYITASRAALLASFRVVHHLIKRKDKKPTPSHPKNIRKRLFEQVNINIFNKNIVKRRKNLVDFGSSPI